MSECRCASRGLGWLREEKLDPSARGSACSSCATILRSPQQAPVFHASLCVCGFSLFLGVGSVLFEGIDELKSAIVLACAPLIAFVVFYFLRKVDSTIAKISAFIYLRNAICPSSRVMFYWYHAVTITIKV